MEDLAPGSRIGDYRVEGELGRGGMSVVFSATHLVIGKRAAIKVLHPILCADATGMIRATQEARAINSIEHPNIVDVYAYGKLPDGRCYLVMERLEGETLHDRMQTRRLSVEECVEILVQLCDALEAAHERGVIHRDIKPANIFLQPVRGRADQVKLLDFGLAKLLEGGTGITRQGAILGTPDYIAPEQARGGFVDARCDLYSLGVVAFEMLCGRLPFDGEDAIALMKKHMDTPAPSLSQMWPEAPRVLEKIIAQMLSKDPQDRPPLCAFRGALTTLDRPASPPTSSWQPVPLRRRPRFAWAALGLVGVCAVALGSHHIRKPSRAPVVRQFAAPLAIVEPPPAASLQERTASPATKPRELDRPRRTRAVAHRKPHAAPGDELLDPFAP